MRIMMIGDVVGKPGRRAVAALLPALRRELALDLVIANGENAAGGVGLTWPAAEELLGAGVDVITSGNHIWRQKEIIPYLNEGTPILRPLNYPPGTPGRGLLTRDGVAVLNLLGRTFLGEFDCPFRAADEALAKLTEKVIIVDMHAEATSEKVAMGWYLDGRASAVLGTHTHVPTADARLLPKGTAYISDVGMVGPRDSVIGVEVETVLRFFLTQMPHRFEPAKGAVSFNAVLVEVDEATGRARQVARVDREWAP